MYVAMRHGSLQNTPAVLEHIEGAITSLYLDLGRFLAPDRRVQLSLDLEDVYFDDEPIVVEVAANEDRRELIVTVEDSTTGAEAARQPMTDRRDGTYIATCGPFPSGSYRVNIRGDENVAPIVDAVGISPRVS
jgi:hypothetical protein